MLRNIPCTCYNAPVLNRRKKTMPLYYSKVPFTPYLNYSCIMKDLRIRHSLSQVKQIHITYLLREFQLIIRFDKSLGLCYSTKQKENILT